MLKKDIAARGKPKQARVIVDGKDGDPFTNASAAYLASIDVPVQGVRWDEACYGVYLLLTHGAGYEGDDREGWKNLIWNVMSHETTVGGDLTAKCVWKDGGWRDLPEEE